MSGAVASHGRRILANALLDLRHRYAGASLGAFWNLLHPAAQIATYTLVFGVLLPQQKDGSVLGYVRWLCAGIVPWLGFVECVTRGTNAFLVHAPYLKKLAVPELVWWAQECCAALLGSGIALALVLLLLLGNASFAWLAVVPVLALWFLFASGLGLLLGTVNVFFRDTAQLVGIALPLAMWLTPIVWSFELVPEASRERAEHWMQWNPAHQFMRAIRGALLQGRAPEPGEWLVLAACAALSLSLGLVVFSRLEPQIRDVL